MADNPDTNEGTTLAERYWPAIKLAGGAFAAVGLLVLALTFPNPRGPAMLPGLACVFGVPFGVGLIVASFAAAGLLRSGKAALLVSTGLLAGALLAWFGTTWMDFAEYTRIGWSIEEIRTRHFVVGAACAGAIVLGVAMARLDVP